MRVVEFVVSGSDPIFFFTTFAILIFLGYLADMVFERWRFNSAVLLIGVGLLVGFLVRAYAADSDPTPVLQSAQPVVGVLALILILFSGGLGLKIHDLVSGVGGASFLGISSFVLTTSGVAAVAWLMVDGLSFTGGLVLGAILGGTSAVVVMPSLAQIRTERRTATMLSLESAITDILVVVTASTLISVLTATVAPGASGVAAGVITLFAMSLFLGGLAGFVWLWLVPFVRDKEFGYMMTLGAAFAVYVATEWILGNLQISSGGGPLAVLAYGIVLGNATDMGKHLRDRVGDAFGRGLARFQGELSFLVRTFFFVYLGILVDVQLLAEPRIILLGLAVFAALALARYLSVALTVRRLRLQGDDWVLWVMMPRGLAAAVLAGVPAQMGIAGSDPFVAVAFLVLILTNLTTTFGGMVVGRGTTTEGPRRPPGSKTAKKKRVEFAGTSAPQRKPASKAGPARRGGRMPPPPVPLSDDP